MGGGQGWGFGGRVRFSVQQPTASSSGSLAGLAAESFDRHAGAAEAAAVPAAAALAAGAPGLLGSARGKSVVQLPFTACMPAQHGTGTTPYALTLLPLSTQAGRVPSHLHVASGQLEGWALQFLSHHT